MNDAIPSTSIGSPKIRNVPAWLVITCVLASPFAFYWGAIMFVEYLRTRDAEPAFAPLQPLRVHISSAPVAFYRHCMYWVMFEEDTKLDDSNSEQLLSLNALPEPNLLQICIQTENFTDRSIPVLEKLRRIDRLDLTASGVSDEGISRLKESLPHTDVWTR